jgi:hypothetical protein
MPHTAASIRRAQRKLQHIVDRDALPVIVTSGTTATGTPCLQITALILTPELRLRLPTTVDDVPVCIVETSTQVRQAGVVTTGKWLLGFFLAHLGRKAYDAVKKKLKLTAIQQLASPYLMEHMARYDRDPDIRGAAARKLLNPRLLRQLLDNERHPVVRSILIGQLPPEALLGLYVGLRDRARKMEIIPHVYDQETYFKLLRNEGDPKLAAQLMPKITNPDYIELLRTHQLTAVREWAVRTLPEMLKLHGDMESNPDKIIDAILSFPTMTPQVQRLLSWVTVPQVFYILVLQHPSMEIKQAALRGLQALRPRDLCKLAADERVIFDLRNAALTLCHGIDLNMVAHLAEADKDARIRAQALSLLEDSPNLDNLLARLAVTETDAVVLTQVVQMAHDLRMLRHLSKRLATLPQAGAVKQLLDARLQRAQGETHASVH